MDYVAVYFYNVSKNKCLRTTGLPESSLIYGACDNSDNTLWIVPVLHNGNYRSKANPDYCLSIEDGIASLKECNESTTLYRDGNFIKSLTSNYCIGSSDENSNEISAKECDINDPDQLWFFNNWNPYVDTEIIENPEDPIVSTPETVTVFLYNALMNECMRSDGASVTIGSCDFSNEESLWEIPISHSGYYHPKANPEKCLSIVDDVVALSDCNETTTLYRDVNFIKSPLSDNGCVSSYKTISDEIPVKECDVNSPDQLWYFNIWDPSIVIEEPPVVAQPGTVTIYLYNAYRNECITSDGTSVATGSCDFTNEESLWEIPLNHSGYYHPKTNSEKCLSIEDGVVSLSDCNEETTTLYRDVNFIKSPLSDNSCISSSEAETDSTGISVKECDVNDPDQLWYFNVYDSSN